MSDEKDKAKWQKTDSLGFKELVDNLHKMTNLVVKKELEEVMGKINTLEKMGVIGEENEALKKIKEKFNKIMEVEK